MSARLVDRVIGEIDRAVDDIVALTAELVRIPTINPPGEGYEPCARLIGDRLARSGFDVEYLAAEGRPEHTSRYPRVNVVGSPRIDDRMLCSPALLPCAMCLNAKALERCCRESLLNSAGIYFGPHLD